MRQVVKISLSAGLAAALLTLAVEALFGKSLSHMALMAVKMGFAASTSTLAIAPSFIRAAQANRALVAAALASAALVLVYPLFAVLNAEGTADIWNNILVSPVFAAFSLPLAAPATALFARCWYKRVRAQAAA